MNLLTPRRDALHCRTALIFPAPVLLAHKSHPHRTVEGGVKKKNPPTTAPQSQLRICRCVTVSVCVACIPLQALCENECEFIQPSPELTMCRNALHICSYTAHPRPSSPLQSALQRIKLRLLVKRNGFWICHIARKCEIFSSSSLVFKESREAGWFQILSVDIIAVVYTLSLITCQVMPDINTHTSQPHRREAICIC